MATQNNQQQIIDPNFYVPKGVVDMRQSDGTDYGYVYTPATEANAGGDAPILDQPNAKVPAPPTSYSVVEQHVRTGSDGSTVVDVIVQFPDVAGVQSIDVRVTKAN